MIIFLTIIQMFTLVRKRIAQMKQQTKLFIVNEYIVNNRHVNGIPNTLMYFSSTKDILWPCLLEEIL